MGTVLYDFLTDSPLFDERLLDEHFPRMEERELEKLLQGYRQFCLDQLCALETELAKSHHALQVFAGTERVSLDLLKQSAFYIQTYILDDPLFKLTSRPSQMSAVTAGYLGYANGKTDRLRLVEVLRYLKLLSPMVAADYVKLLPVSYMFESPAAIPFHYSEDGFADVLPRPLLDFLRKRSRVCSLFPAETGWYTSGSLEPSRGILVAFGDHPRDGNFIYHLFNTSWERCNADENVLTGRMTIPNEPPDKDYFEAWVSQSINQASRAFHDLTISQVALAQGLNASFLTNSSVVFALLQEMGLTGSSIEAETANIVLKLNLPFLEGIDTNTLMSVRQSDGEAFQAFRDEMEKRFLELRSEKDRAKVELKCENAVHDLSEIQVRAMERQVKALKKKASKEVCLALAGLTCSVATGGWSLLAVAVACFQGYKTFDDYQRSVRQSPAFFLWKVLRS